MRGREEREEGRRGRKGGEGGREERELGREEGRKGGGKDMTAREIGTGCMKCDACVLFGSPLEREVSIENHTHKPALEVVFYALHLQEGLEQG